MRACNRALVRQRSTGKDTTRRDRRVWHRGAARDCTHVCMRVRTYACDLFSVDFGDLLDERIFYVGVEGDKWISL